MKILILRILISAILISLISGVVVSLMGLVLTWKTSTQFSDGFFWAGAAMAAIGFISLQGYSQRAINWPPVSLIQMNAPVSGGRHLSWQNHHGYLRDFGFDVVRHVRSSFEAILTINRIWTSIPTAG